MTITQWFVVVVFRSRSRPVPSQPLTQETPQLVASTSNSPPLSPTDPCADGRRVPGRLDRRRHPGVDTARLLAADAVQKCGSEAGTAMSLAPLYTHAVPAHDAPRSR